MRAPTEGSCNVQEGRWRRLCPACPVCRRQAQAESRARPQQRPLRLQMIRADRMVRARTLHPSLHPED